MKRKSTDTRVVEVKTIDFEIKAAGPEDDLAEGEFVGYASAFGNVDSYGDIVEPTFFDRTLEEWKASGDTIPILWGHDLFDPFSFIGGALDASADEKGLRIHGSLDLAENPKAAQVYRLLKGRRVRKMSFAYATRDSEQLDDGNHLKDGDLFEVSIVPIPANDEAEIVTVKAALAPLMKAGRVLSSKNEKTLREARDAIDSVLSALEAQDGGDEAGTDKAPAHDPATASGDPSPAKADGQTEDPPGDKVPSSTEEHKSGPSVEDWETLFKTTAAFVSAEGDV